MPSFRLTRLARRDLAEIGRYTAGRWGALQRDRYLEALFDEFQRLADEIDRARRPTIWFQATVAGSMQGISSSSDEWMAKWRSSAFCTTE
jgi:hypothetical protein